MPQLVGRDPADACCIYLDKPGIKSRPRGIVQDLRRWMKAMQTVRPASNDNDLIKPWQERFDQTRERREVRIAIHTRPIRNR